MAAFGATAVILVALVVVASAAGAASLANGAPFKYVALGDSFSAGEGVDPYFRDGFNRTTGRQGVIDNGCHRSSRAYSTWVKRPADAKTLYAIASGGGKPGSFGGKNKVGSDKNVRSVGGVTWAFWACSGAATENVLPKSLGGVPQQEAGQTYDRGTQLDSANLTGADLVTLTIGGNDAGFVDALFFCAVTNCNTQAFEQGRTTIIDGTRPLLEKVYRAVARKAPRARILVLGYPQLFPATQAEQSCVGLSLFLGEQNMLRKLGVHLNHTIEAAVKSVAKSGAKIEYVPVAARFAGHEVCGRKGPWINGIGATQNSPGGGSFHPTLQGQQDGYAAAVNAAVRRER
jgi:lysophospholipase L1-like esterase